MWSYYGSKSKIINLYPPPKYGKIIEPFAGSARYALKWFDRDVLLVDKYDKIIKIWTWLQKCTKNDILNLPSLTYKQSVDDFNLSDEEKLFLGFLVAGAAASPQKIVQKFSNIENDKKRIAQSLWKIKHWKIICGDYLDIKNINATWFVDPPYQYGGEHYNQNNKSINYNSLEIWCKNRIGHVIVCENTKANWMEFMPIKQIQGAYSKTTEAIWTNIPTSYNVIQTSLL